MHKLGLWWLILVLVVGCSNPAPKVNKITPLAPGQTNLPLAVIPPVAPVTPPVETIPPPPLPTREEDPSQEAAPTETPLEVTPLPTPSQVVGWIPLMQALQQLGMDKVDLVLDKPEKQILIRAGQNRFSLVTGTRQAEWQNTQIHLGHAPRWHENQFWVHSIDWDKNIRPLLQNIPPLRLFSPVIVLDPGHGGINAGTQNSTGQVLEKDLTLDWAIRTHRLLVTQGWQVYLTRTNDVDITLLDRVAFADRVQAQLFISLHFNSVPGPGARTQSGLETYILTPAGIPSNLVRGFPDELRMAFTNNRHDQENLLWAWPIHQGLLAGTDLKDRGLRRARFMTVIREQNRPALLIEGGYLSHPQESQRLAQPAFRQLLAEKLARALYPFSPQANLPAPAPSQPTIAPTQNP